MVHRVIDVPILYPSIQGYWAPLKLVVYVIGTP